ncbi:hypothetical protein Ahy_A10g046816 isoform E [Arachis hypogaea]|uniref:Uncharacterized protein n=1 Tax=Arachis hypogaea TaxID=3818 RepID=A0A445B0L6_ARAHY|nr:hypothetical protein Ahy_A10g046816 isoform E [Arachis hypogaea]
MRPLIMPMSDILIMRIKRSRDQGRFLNREIKDLFPISNILGMLCVIVTKHFHSISSNLVLLFFALTKELSSCSFNFVSVIKWDPMVDYLKEPPLFACTANFLHKPIKGRRVVKCWQNMQR